MIESSDIGKPGEESSTNEEQGATYHYQTVEHREWIEGEKTFARSPPEAAARDPLCASSANN